MLSGLEAWGHLLTDIPHVGVNLLRDIEHGDLPIHVQMEPPKPIMDRIDRLITRLSLSMLLAAFIVGMALVVPLAAGNSIILALAIVGFAIVLMLAGWLVVSILRNR